MERCIIIIKNKTKDKIMVGGNGMIINYKFNNFMSFRENVEFSLMTPKTKVKTRFPNNYVDSERGVEVLKTAVIVGENAGGKSNFVRSLDYLQHYFKGNDKAKAYQNTLNTNNVLDECPKKCITNQQFEIEVLFNELGIYLYQLELDAFGIITEKLAFKSHYKQKYKDIFVVERNEQIVECKEECTGKNGCHTIISTGYTIGISENNQSIAESLQNAAQRQKLIGLFITKFALLGDEHAINFTEWMKNSLFPETNIINYDIYKSMENAEDDLRILNDERYLKILKMVDHSIIEIEIDKEKPYKKTLIKRKKENGDVFYRELSKDSSGVREFFAWAVQIFRVVYENKIVFADEMDRVLNPVLSDRVVSFINGKTHFGQFIFTTHNVLHLDLKNYMKEQIYFITKDIENLESELYSLADFPEIRYETTKIYEFYMKGILGGTAVE